MNILIIKPSSLGDIIHTFPAVALLRERFPDATISWVVNSSLTGVVDLFPGVDEIIAFPRQRLARVRNAWCLVSFLRELRQRRYDVAVDFQGLLRSGLIAYASRAPERVGFRNAREGAALFYTNKVLLPANLKHAVDRNVFMVRSAFDIHAPMRPPELKAQHDFVKCANNLLKRHGLRGHRAVLAVAPAARWSSKRWPPEFFAAVVDRVADLTDDVAVWILGTQAERPLAAAVAAACAQCRPVVLAGETNLGTLAELLRRSDVLLTNDSGPMHLAAALGTRTVAFFGATDPELTGPYGEGHRVFKGSCDIGPCFRRECIRDKHVCTSSVSAKQVSQCIADMLSETVADAVPLDCQSAAVGVEQGDPP